MRAEWVEEVVQRAVSQVDPKTGGDRLWLQLAAAGAFFITHSRPWARCNGRIKIRWHSHYELCFTHNRGEAWFENRFSVKLSYGSF